MLSQDLEALNISKRALFTSVSSMPCPRPCDELVEDDFLTRLVGGAAVRNAMPCWIPVEGPPPLLAR
eukprot:5881324-Lingulodinium_polyedra.AAC.1